MKTQNCFLNDSTDQSYGAFLQSAASSLLPGYLHLFPVFIKFKKRKKKLYLLHDIDYNLALVVYRDITKTK